MTSTFDLRDYPVLYVDDEETNLIVFEAAFGDEFNVRTACSGQQALELLAKERIAAVISDYRMPGMNGVELLERVRSRHPGVLRLMATAYTDPATTIAAINNAGVLHYIPKPFDEENIRETVRNTLRRAHLDETTRQLRTAMIERERLAGLAAARAAIIHDLANMSEVVDTCCSNLEAMMGSATVHPEVWEVVHEMREAVNYFVEIHGRSRTALETSRPAVHRADEILRTVVRLAARSARVGTLVRYEPTELTVFGDRVDVSRVLVNLASNAVQAIEEARMPDGEVRLSARVAGNHIVFVVTDNGPGIADEIRERIFELHFTTRKAHGGNGIGLNVCRELARNNNGGLHAYPSPHGARFELSLPQREPVAASRTIAPTPNPAVARNMAG